jgi:signal transduction histidine kinase
MDRWNPRLHLSAAIGWTVFALIALAALLAANLAASDAERRARADAQGLLEELAAQSEQMLAARLDSHGLLLLATAAQIAASGDRGSDAVRRHLEALQRQFPEFVWLGVADARGRVVAGTAGALQGEDVSAVLWFARGRDRLRLGSEPASPPPPVAAMFASGTLARVIDISAPLVGATGAQVGVLAGYLSWPWLQALQVEMLRSLGPARGLELLLTAPGGTVLAGPAAWLDRPVGTQTDLGESDRYLVARAVRRTGLGEGWAQTVRQPMEQALAPARAVRRSVFWVVLLSGLLAGAAAMAVTRAMMRRLASLARDADAVRRGDKRTLTVPDGVDDVSHIGAALAELVGQLQQDKQALEAINRELDARVAERTARIERLAEESRQAAVTRERLRMARELHDTLSHSLMALLTQIRLIRKLRGRLDTDALDAELARAEEATASGLVEARAAIAQMRFTGVADAGLGASLKELLKRFGERTGIAVSLDADVQAAQLADTRAETVYRIVEEALRNVERHARASHVALTVRWQASAAAGEAGSGTPGPGRVVVSIVDDGIGFDPAMTRPGHFGLQGMREQASLIDAQLELHSRPGQGTRVELSYGA